jgi:hypothetical protein
VFNQIAMNVVPGGNIDIGPATTSMANVSGLSTGSVTVPAAGTYLIEFDTNWFGIVAGSYVGVRFGLDIGGTTFNFSRVGYAANNGNIRHTYTDKALIALPAGTHTVTARWQVVDNGGATARVDPACVFKVTVSGGAALARASEQTRYYLTRTGNSQVQVQARHGTLLRLHMDVGEAGAVKEATGPLTFDFANGNADLGLDSDSSEGASTWYYLYAVPTGTQSFTLRASDNPPSSGPTGYTTWKYLGAFHNDVSQNIVLFVHDGKRFSFDRAQKDYTLSSNVSEGDYTLTFCPVSASHVELGAFAYASVDPWSAHRIGTPGNTVGFPDYHYVISAGAPGGHASRDTGVVPLNNATATIRRVTEGGGTPNHNLFVLGWWDAYVDPKAV